MCCRPPVVAARWASLFLCEMACLWLIWASRVVCGCTLAFGGSAIKCAAPSVSVVFLFSSMSNVIHDSPPKFIKLQWPNNFSKAVFCLPRILHFEAILLDLCTFGVDAVDLGFLLGVRITVSGWYSSSSSPDSSLPLGS